MKKFFAVLGVIFMILSGGCMLIAARFTGLSGGWSDVQIILSFGSLPFLFGLLMHFVASRSLKNQTMKNVATNQIQENQSRSDEMDPSLTKRTNTDE